MMTKMTGTLVRVLDDEVRVSVGPFEYQLLVPESVRRLLQMKVGQEIVFHTSEYLEGNQSGSRFVPRKIGFLTEMELEFFDLFCTVDKIGVKKALKALSRSPKEIANAISREDAKWLTTLPGIGATTAEQIVSTLKRKVTKYALASDFGQPGSEGEAVPVPSGAAQLIEDIYQALMSVGLNPLEARSKLDSLLKSGQKFDTIEAGLTLIYSK
ncbi:Holliday junction branch migration protein RuvA [Limnoglobus roseus]|uniref:Holliday junction branch migration complex subunit RuvA n=1 Tax=Limnoglobus roseus TaxID=2598579 RepID=A0A5C1ADY0_9BACT|nr:Holliday junction branch migration protein RuvA [Limnoglobus roseus]QEL15278.1 ATP-dependent DNA helicase RuvA [Limnoglobus roseus]